MAFNTENDPDLGISLNIWGRRFVSNRNDPSIHADTGEKVVWASYGENYDLINGVLVPRKQISTRKKKNKRSDYELKELLKEIKKILD